jgi:hypothetical protein
MNFGSKIVALVVILNVIFTQEIIWLYHETQSEPTVLIGAWFAFTTGELWMLASIKKTKVKKAKREEANKDGTDKI